MTAVMRMIVWGMLPDVTDVDAYKKIRSRIRAELREYGMKLTYGGSDIYNLRAHRNAKLLGRSRRIMSGPLVGCCYCALSYIEPETYPRK